MSEFTLGLLGLGIFIIALFLYAELVLLKVPFKELFWRKKNK